MAPTIQCAMRVGLTVMLQSSVTGWGTVLSIIVSVIIDLNDTLFSFMYLYHTTVGSEATGGRVFGLSDRTPILQNLMCNGSEYTLRDCPGYDINAISGDYCLSGDYQAGVRCISTDCNTDIRFGNERYGITPEGFDFVGGRVEICENGIFGAICDIGWNQEAAQAACDRLGYSDRGK